MEKIDFVILWVDGNDPEWLREKNKYFEIEFNKKSNSNNRYRDWDLLRYWFRGVEKNAPWVNNIYFVTYGHIPNWLNVNNPKINIVKHEDFIPKEYLPTFNSNVIQYYLHNIKGLSDRFVMFDDDQFLLKEVHEKDFFVGDNICDEYCEQPFYYSKLGDVYPHCLLNNMQCINKFYSKKRVYHKYPFKYFNFKYGLTAFIKTFIYSFSSQFVGIYSPHICQAYTKEAYELMWKYCNDELVNASSNRFRNYSDFSTFLVRYIILMEGKFVSRSHKFGKRLELGIDDDKIYKSIKNKKYNVICINDSLPDIDFDGIKEKLINSFETIYPNKSEYEI